MSVQFENHTKNENKKYRKIALSKALNYPPFIVARSRISEHKLLLPKKLAWNVSYPQHTLLNNNKSM